MNARGSFKENAVVTAVLFEAGVALMRQNLRRRHLEENDAHIDDRLRALLRRADDPVQGDAAGAVRPRERPS